ncbi:hypothetical protein GCM10009736_64070 [Actinomadura bangladeshensis]
MVGQPAAQPRRVAVDGVAEEQFVPDREQFDSHGVRIYRQERRATGTWTARAHPRFTGKCGRMRTARARRVRTGPTGASLFRPGVKEAAALCPPGRDRARQGTRARRPRERGSSPRIIACRSDKCREVQVTL